MSYCQSASPDDTGSTPFHRWVEPPFDQRFHRASGSQALRRDGGTHPEDPRGSSTHQEESPTQLRKLTFVDSITLIEMPRKFSFPNMKMYDGTTDPTNHIASYKQRMFTAAIPREQREACMCKSFGSSLQGPALQWYTNLANNSISSFA